MKLFVVAATLLLIFIGVIAYQKNHSRQQGQPPSYAKPAENPKAAKPPTEGDAVPVGDSPQNLSDDLLELNSLPQETLLCASKTVATIQSCLRLNNIEKGSEEGSALIALSRRGQAEFQSVPHASNGKCYVDIRISGKYNDKEIDRLLKDCEVE